MLSCRMLGRNAALTMKKTEIPEFRPIRSLSIRCPMCHANPKQVCIGGRARTCAYRPNQSCCEIGRSTKNRKK